MKLDEARLRRELSQGLAWPVYWIHGPERLLVRRLVAQLRETLAGSNSWAEEKLDGATAAAADVLAAARSVPFGGGLRLVVVRDAHLIREPDSLAELFGKPAKFGDLPFTCIFVAKDLDGRRKFSKQLVEHAAVVECEAISEANREAWISRLAGDLGLDSSRLPIEALLRTDPWTLEAVESELRKWTVAEAAEPGMGESVLVTGDPGGGRGDRFIEAFLVRRDLRASLEFVHSLASGFEEGLMMAGLLAWNVRTLALLAANPRSVRLPPAAQDRLVRALRAWKIDELQALRAAISEMDFAFKQTPQEPLALWGVLISNFCRKS